MNGREISVPKSIVLIYDCTAHLLSRILENMGVDLYNGFSNEVAGESFRCVHSDRWMFRWERLYRKYVDN